MPEETVKGVRERAKKLRRQRRMPSVNAPTRDALAFPDSLADLPTQELSNHLTYWSSWAAYTQNEVAILEGAAGTARAEFEMEWDLRYSSSNYNSVTDKRHTVGASKAVRLKRRIFVQLEVDSKIMRAMFLAYERYYNAVSRELTRRLRELERLGS